MSGPYVGVSNEFLDKLIDDLGGKKLKGAAATLHGVFLFIDFPIGGKDNGEFYMHPRELAERMRKSVAQIYRHLNILCELGYLFKTDYPHVYRANKSLILGHGED